MSRARTFAFCRCRRAASALVLVGLAAALAPVTANAMPLSFAFHGTIDSAQNLDLISQVPFSAGAAIDGRYTVETDENGVSSITFGDGTPGRRLPVGDGSAGSNYRSGSGASGNVDVSLPCALLVDSCWDFRYEVMLRFPSHGGLPETLLLQLMAEDDQAARAALVDGSIAPFQVRHFVWTVPLNDETSAVLEGTLTAHALIPEPGTLALLGIGLAGLGFSPRRRAS